MQKSIASGKLVPLRHIFFTGKWDTGASTSSANETPSNPPPVVGNSVPGTRPKILVRFRTNNNCESDDVADEKESTASEGERNNKRLRREIKKTSYYRDVAAASQEETQSPRSKTSRLFPGRSAQVKVKKLQGVPIALTREEIEEDILAMTRGIEGRMGRDKKMRTSKVQEELDNRFPGLLLPYINVRKYANRRIRNNVTRRKA